MSKLEEILNTIYLWIKADPIVASGLIVITCCFMFIMIGMMFKPEWLVETKEDDDAKE